MDKMMVRVRDTAGKNEFWLDLGVQSNDALKEMLKKEGVRAAPKIVEPEVAGLPMSRYANEKTSLFKLNGVMWDMSQMADEDCDTLLEYIGSGRLGSLDSVRQAADKLIAARHEQVQLSEVAPTNIFERDLLYSSDKMDKALGCVGHLRGYFGSTGTEYQASWFSHQPQLRTPLFVQDLKNTVGHLRSIGLLSTRGKMSEYCAAVPNAKMPGERVDAYGLHIDSADYSYYIRCNPSPGDYEFYVYAYDKDTLSQYMAQAEQSPSEYDEQSPQGYDEPQMG